MRGREIFLHCPNGVARTKLTNDYFDAKLATTSTMRNWRTVLKLRCRPRKGKEEIAMKKIQKKVVVRKETFKILSPTDLARVLGGAAEPAPGVTPDEDAFS